MATTRPLLAPLASGSGPSPRPPPPSALPSRQPSQPLQAASSCKTRSAPMPHSGVTAMAAGRNGGSGSGATSTSTSYSSSHIGSPSHCRHHQPQDAPPRLTAAPHPHPHRRRQQQRRPAPFTAAAAGPSATDPSAPEARDAASAAAAEASASAAEAAEAAWIVEPAPDLASAMDRLSRTSSFPQLASFLGSNASLFPGPEVAAVVLQAANVAELSAERRLAAAMAVVERRAAAMAAAGEAGQDAITPDLLAGAMEELMYSQGGGGGGEDGGGSGGGGTLAELEAADELMGWATPLLRNHIKRYPPDTVAALVAALAQLNQYDRRLMELVAGAVKDDTGGWLRRAAAAAAGPSLGSGAERQGKGQGAEAAAVEEEGDPWSVLLSLARCFAQLGHYDAGLMAALAEQAVELMPRLAERAEAADAAVEEAAAAADGGGDGGGNGRMAAVDGSATETVVALLDAFLELNHLDPALMQAAGEHLAAFSHQLDAASAAEALQVFAAFNARNPPFYSILLRQAAEGAQDSLTPRSAGALYRACVLIAAMNEVPALAPGVLGAGVGDDDEEGGQRASGSSSSSGGVGSGGEARQVAASLASLLLGCLGAFPAAQLRAAHLACPSVEQIEEADDELLEAWRNTGLLTVPQVISCLQRVSDAEILPPQVLTPTSTAAALAALAAEEAAEAAAEAAAAAADGSDGSGNAAAQPPPPAIMPNVPPCVVGGEEAVVWLPADALLAYDKGDGTVVRVAVKVLDEQRHCCLSSAESSFGSAAASELPSSRDPAGEDGTEEGLSESPLRLRLRGRALAELRCLESWGWRVLVVPVGEWAAMGSAAAHERWLTARLQAIAAAEGPMGPELVW